MKSMARFVIGCIAVVSMLVLSMNAQNVPQTILLQPGWNAVWLEVQPEDNKSATVFSNLPISSVWSFAQPLTSVDYIQNASEAEFNEAGWLGWLPPPRPDAFLSDLFAVFANRAYIILCTNSTPFLWNISGRPSLRQPGWVPDKFNLRGLPVDTNSLPTFVNYFLPSKAHYNAATTQLEAVYKLDSASGQWQAVAPGEAVQSGRAYWIFTKGASDYVAPMDVQAELGDGLDFSSELSELNLIVRNRASTNINMLLRDYAGGSNKLSYLQFNAALGNQWPVLPSPLMMTIQRTQELRLSIGVRRQDFSTDEYRSVVEVRDGTGTRIFLPVFAAGNAQVSPSSLKNLSTHPLAGLWVGAARINGVSEVASSSTNATPVKSEMNLRVIVHVDATGHARLLKEVIQMWRNGTFTNNGTAEVPDKPGQFVLLTDDSLISLFSGSTLRDGELVGRRISTVGYSFPGGNTNNFLNLTGAFAVGQKLNGTLALPHDDPVNPFKHRYHPDHDNMDARFELPALESYTTSRQIEFSFESSPPPGSPTRPDFGYNVMGGVYREKITGIHKKEIHLSGQFQLSRVSQIAELNPSPTP
jgi:hypothetical protein